MPKAVHMLINDLLPEDLRSDDRVYDKKEVGELIREVSQREPDGYADFVNALKDLGRKSVYLQGSTLKLEDFDPGFDKDAVLRRMDQELESVKKIPDEKERRKKRLQIYTKYAEQLTDLSMESGKRKGSALAGIIASGARGNPSQYRSMIATPAVYSDYNDEPIDMFVRRSFGEGVRPIDFLASTFGTRKSTIATKSCWMEGTLVRMADLSVKPIENIKTGDMVLGSDDRGHVSPAKVTKTFDQGFQEVFEYSVGLNNSGKVWDKVCCTEDHKLLQFSPKAYRKAYTSFYRDPDNKQPPCGSLLNNREILESSHLRKRYFKCALPVGTYEPECVKYEPYAAFLGAVLGDGFVARRGNTFCCDFSCADSVMLNDMEIMLSQLGLKIVKQLPEDPSSFGYRITSVDYTPADNNSTVKGHKNFLSCSEGAGVAHRNKLRDEGLAGKFSFEKTLPKNIHEWDNKSVAKLVAYYFAFAGSVSRTQRVVVSMASTSSELLDQIREILKTRFSIYIQDFEKHTIGGFDIKTSPRSRPLYILKISSEDSLRSFFYNIQPHIPGYKRDKAYTLITDQLENQVHHFPDSLTVRSVRPLGLRPCFDIEVNNNSHLFVLASGVIGSNSTADAGDFGKLLVQSATPIMVTRRNSNNISGILLDPQEDRLRGRVLARETAGYGPGTVVDRRVEADIRNKHKGRVMVHSPLSEVSDEGISGEAFGVSYTGDVPGPGFAAGVTAGNALAEPVAQGSLNTKHSGGAFGGGKKEFSGFDYISQFVQVPKNFKDRAAVSEKQGRVQRVEDAPQGGQYVYVDDIPHYVLPGFDVSVKPGDEVEPGDPLSDGLVNPRDVVRLRGLGEGRKYYSRRLKQLLDDSGQPADLRNTEVIARGALDSVRITDDEGWNGYLPDDVISYNKLEADWTPREGWEKVSAKNASGKYLEAPILHYTVGTKLTPRMTKEIEEAGFENVPVHSKEPPFEPLQIRLRTNAFETSEDWLARMGSSNLQKNLAESAQKGYDTNLNENIHPLPRLAVGEKFGDKAHQTGKF